MKQEKRVSSKGVNCESVIREVLLEMTSGQRHQQGKRANTCTSVGSVFQEDGTEKTKALRQKLS